MRVEHTITSADSASRVRSSGRRISINGVTTKARTRRCRVLLPCVKLDTLPGRISIESEGMASLFELNSEPGAISFRRLSFSGQYMIYPRDSQQIDRNMEAVPFARVPAFTKCARNASEPPRRRAVFFSSEDSAFLLCIQRLNTVRLRVFFSIQSTRRGCVWVVGSSRGQSRAE